jgi:hypothetical protein
MTHLLMAAELLVLLAEVDLQALGDVLALDLGG